MFFLSAVLLAASAAAGEYTPEAIADQIVSLPGTDDIKIPFNQFSGYLKVSETKNMHYWFVESTNSVENDPIAFWTNGGPGCSGLLGFLTEQGPFRVNEDLTLKMNEYAWNTVANMVFIESPCGVGFSYSDDPDNTGDYHIDDDGAAKDNYALIQAFLTRFPQFRSNKLVITSESYGGHYMPTLAKEIVDQNEAKGKDSVEYINFKGFAVGNPDTTFYSAIPASLDTYWGHQLISKPTWDQYQKSCLGTHLHPQQKLEYCETLFLAMYHEVGNLNPYALDYPVCTEDSPRKYGRNQRAAFINHKLNCLGGNTVDENTMAKVKQSLSITEDTYEPCADNYMGEYLNKDEVKNSIHVKTDIKWTDCNQKTLRYKQTDGGKSMTPYYNYLIDNKSIDLDILVYSGDDDDVCATIGTQSWIWDLGYNVSSHWKDWTVDQQTAGYITKWKDTNLVFATVHGAGHEVPTYKPKEALDLWERYLTGTL